MEFTPIQATGAVAEARLERLARDPKATEHQKATEAARQFEAILLRQILTRAQQPVIRSAYNEDSTVKSIYRDLLVQHQAEAICSRGGVGLAQSLASQLCRQNPADPPPPAVPRTD